VSVRSLGPNKNLLSEVVHTIFGIATISIPLASVVILICR
jgi:hypothetical protein